MRPFDYSSVHSPFGGDEEDRTPDPLLAKQVLSQLSYTPARLSLFTGLFLFSRSLSEPSKLNNDAFTLPLLTFEDFVKLLFDMFSLERR